MKKILLLSVVGVLALTNCTNDKDEQAKHIANQRYEKTNFDSNLFTINREDIERPEDRD